ncbi:MAG: GTPase HflX [Clostridiales bacterium GWC2_40_7]|nr:MAG: GTPase HflX [Clostridiales bacterium GWC2_40_7]
MEAERDELIPWLLAERLAVLTGKINREIAVYINRKGSITNINIGDSGTVALPEVEGRRGKTRLSGIRCIHTHPNGDGRLSSVDINSLLSLNLDAMIALGVKNGVLEEVYIGLPSDQGDGRRDGADMYGPFENNDISLNHLFDLIYERDGIIQVTAGTGRGSKEKALLVGLEIDAGRLINGKSEGTRSLEELEELALTAGLEVLDKVLQKRSVKDAALYMGRGKIEQLGLMLQASNAGVLVFDDELSGAQIRNIEAMTGAKVIDRTALILDIFAQRARSSEGKLQVELAQLKYRLPRLTGMGGQLSRLGGGIGTRGPGEKKLEVDRRHIRKRISSLDNELKAISKRRSLIREGRKQNEIPVIALVGYTNSGKSTLMNILCNTDVFAEDKLFATLDPSTRKLLLPDGRLALLVDTVGFIRKLPHELIEAFKSTLEEVVYADMLLHVVDAADEEVEEQIPVAEAILNNLGASGKPAVLVLNKMDIVLEKQRLPISAAGISSVEISAVKGDGLDELLKMIMKTIPSDEMEYEIYVPYSAGGVVSYVHENGKLLEEEYTGDGTRIRVRMKRARAEKIREFIV